MRAVTIDLYHSDTGAFADYNLPAATIYEKGGFHFLTSSFEPYPYAEWKPKVVEPRGERDAGVQRDSLPRGASGQKLMFEHGGW